jgi:hypothetical protein
MKHIKLYEYFNSDVNLLMKYLTMSEAEKKERLAEMYPQLDYMCPDDVPYPEFLWDMFKNELTGTVRVLASKHGVSMSTLPSWLFLKYVNIVKKDGWLVHSTDLFIARRIMEIGFQYGVNSKERLGLTKHVDMEDKKGGGYTFAFTLDDLIKDPSAHQNYGDSMVVFKASGVRCYHNTDMEHQTIIWGETASDYHMIRKMKMDEGTLLHLIATVGYNELLEVIEELGDDGRPELAKRMMGELGKSSGVSRVAAVRRVMALFRDNIIEEKLHTLRWRMSRSGVYTLFDKRDSKLFSHHSLKKVLMWISRHLS